MSAAENIAPAKTRKRVKRVHWLRWFIAILLLIVLGWFAWVGGQIRQTANVDNAQVADAIAVFGAAEYAGRPSPVLHARLDKAVALYNRSMAPVIITLGGGGDLNSGKTEGGVGRDYLLANGVPFDRIIPETQSIDTEQQVNTSGASSLSAMEPTSSASLCSAAAPASPSTPRHALRSATSTTSTPPSA
jgi:uncharacterized SAM-binding protein YcdF (DUF218 family)